MIREITIANEAQLVNEYRRHLHSEARRIIQDQPGRDKATFARITFPSSIRHVSLYGVEAHTEFKVEFI